MLRKTAQICLLIATIFGTFTLVQAQTSQLPVPRNLRVANDALLWDAVENASGYRVRWLAPGPRDWVTEAVAQNQFSLSELSYHISYIAQVQAVSDIAAYQDSFWSRAFILERPDPTATPSITPTATLTATSTATDTPLPTAIPTNTQQPTKPPTDIPTQPPEYYLHKASRSETLPYFPNIEDALRAQQKAKARLKEAARNAVRKCKSGDKQISSWIDVTVSGQTVTATAYIRCLKNG